MKKLFVALSVFASTASIAQTSDEIKVVPATATATATVAESQKLKSTCSVTSSNGFTGTANCDKGTVAVINPKEKLQCVPRTKLVKKGDHYFFPTSPTSTDRVTPCKDGQKVG